MIFAIWLQPAATPGGAVQEMQSINGQFWDVVKLLFVLAGVLLMAYVVTRHWLPRMMGAGRPAIGPMSVVARYTIEPRKTLYIVRAGSEYVLLGCSEGQISFLKDLPAAAIQADLRGDTAAAPAIVHFGDVIKRWGRPRRSA